MTVSVFCRPFPVTLENPHVIDPSQVSVSIVKQGPESIVLNSNYQNRFAILHF